MKLTDFFPLDCSSLSFALCKHIFAYLNGDEMCKALRLKRRKNRTGENQNLYMYSLKKKKKKIILYRIYQKRKKINDFVVND